MITANTVLITSKAGTWELLTSNKLRKQTHSGRQHEVAIIMYHHTVGENGLGLN